MSKDVADEARGRISSAEEGARQRLSIKPLLTLKPLILAHKGALWGAVIALVVSALAVLVVPVAVRRMIDNGFGANDSALINNYFLTLIGIGLLLAIASPARYYFVNWIGERVVADLRTKVFAQLSKLGPAYFDRSHSGELMSRLTADTTQIKAVAGSALSQAARNLIMLIGALIMMFVSSAKLSLLVFIAIPIIVLPLVGFGRMVRRLSRNRAGYARRRIRVCRGKSRRAPDDAGLRQRESRHGSFRPRGGEGLQCGASAYARTRGADRHCDLPDGREHHRRSLVWRVRRHRRRYVRRPARPVCPLRAVCGWRACGAVRSLGRNHPGRRRCRAAFRNDGDDP